MADSLKKIRLLPKYYKDEFLLSEEFWVPVLRASSQIKIIVKSFSQNALFRLLKVIHSQIAENSDIRLVLNPLMSSSEHEAIDGTKNSKELSSTISEFLSNDIYKMDKKTKSEYADILNYLGERSLPIKVAFPLSNENQSNIDKAAPLQNSVLFTDSFDDSIAFSEDRLSRDISIESEEIKITWSWGDPKCLVYKKAIEFDEIWENKHDGFNVIEFEADTILQVINEVVDEQDQSRFELFNHQKKAIEKWAENSFRGIFKMCTGAGKTIAALAGLKRLEKYLLDSGENLDTAVVICPTKILVEQWKREIISFGFDQTPLLAYDSIDKYYKRLGIYLNRKRHKGLRIVITTDVTFSKSAFAHQIRKAESEGTIGCLIADEMHNYASKLNYFKEHREYFRYRLGLSATPEIEDNDSSTQAMFKYFGGIVGEYVLSEAISDGVLCQYKYYPKPVFLDDRTSRRFYKLLKSISEQHGRIDVNLYRERSDLLRKSKVYLPALNDILNDIGINKNELIHLLTFCPPGREDTNQDTRLIEEVKAIYEERGILCSSITAETRQKDRPKILERFGNGFFKVLLAIGCLDEGFDLPSTRRAIMLYSIDRERQFIQRRGRVLRKAEGKEFAIIHDIIILPHNSDLDANEAEKLLSKEMRRYKVFADLSINSEEARLIVDNAISCAIMKGAKYAEINRK
jgi:superfamily II DNA or RNA helicase